MHCLYISAEVRKKGAFIDKEENSGKRRGRVRLVSAGLSVSVVGAPFLEMALKVWRSLVGLNLKPSCRKLRLSAAHRHGEYEWQDPKSEAEV